jgi:CheY-like chemotaxis protein
LKKNNKDISVLIVEDNTYVISLLSTILKKEKFNVFTSSNGEDALIMLDRYGLKIIDLVITDYQMPKMNGFELMDKIKLSEKFQHIPVMLLSQYNNSFFNDENQKKVKQADSVVHKSNIYKSLIPEIKRLLEKN